MSSLPLLKPTKRSGLLICVIPSMVFTQCQTPHEVHISECTHCQGMPVVARHCEVFKGPWQFVAKIASVVQKEARRCRSEVGTERGAETNHRLRPPNSWSHQLHSGKVRIGPARQEGSCQFSRASC